MDEKQIAFFWNKVQRGTPDQCWEWQGWRHVTGYGDFVTVRPQRAHNLTHRVAWTLTNGPIPDGLMVMHKCDNRPCCNPSHLMLGTALDNIRDMDSKGRRGVGSHANAPRGEDHANTSLTEADVLQIRREGKPGLYRELGRRFGLDRKSVKNIVERKTWTHI